MPPSQLTKSLGILVLFVAGVFAAHAPSDAPNMILVNGRVFTGADSQPYAEAVAIKGTRILAVDTSEKISSLAGPNTRRIDLGGHLVIPGLNDVHTHFGLTPVPTAQGDSRGTMVDFGGPEPACAQVLERLEQAARNASPGTLLLGVIGPVAFFDPACTPAALDKIAPQDPVALWTWTPHAAMLNQAAAQKFGIHQSDPPPLGGWFGKDMKSKKWDGVVHEGAWFRIFQTLSTDRPGEQAGLRRYLDREAQWGVTSITLMEVEPARRIELLSAIDSRLRVRLVPFLPFQEQNRRLKPQYPPVPSSIADRVSVTGVKWLLDGSPIERSAAMRAPYTDDPSASGQLDFPPQEIRAILQEALQQNTQPLLHAVGDRSSEALLNEMEATGGAATWSQRRLRIEHGDGLMPDLIPRAKKLGVIVVENPTHFTLGELLQHRYGPERTAVFQPFRSLLDAGIPLAIASDGGPGAPNLNPYLNLMLAASYPGKPKESLTLEQALTAYTRTAAYAEFAEKDKGTLEPGKFADLAVLSQDIFKIPSPELPKTESLLTFVGGKIAYSSGALAEK
jgi:predicted amidohydrolase YtcJ